MTEQEILSLNKCVLSKNATRTIIHINVFHVARGCFNDERLVESLELRVEDIEGRELYWFDLYLGRKKDNKIKAAVAYIDKEYVYFLLNDEESIRVVKNSYTVLASDDLDKSCLIATHVW